MQTSTTSSEFRAVVRNCATRDTVGQTPLIRLVRSGEGRVLVKHEGLNPGGSLYDRIADAQVSQAAGDIVVRGSDSLAFAAALSAARLGRRAVVVLTPGEAKQKEASLSAVGCSVRICEPDQIDSLVSSIRSAGAAEVRGDSDSAVVTALRRVAGEVEEAGVAPEIWVLPDLGVDVLKVRAALAVAGSEPYLELVRISEPDSVGRPSQPHEREGISLTPLGVEIVEAAEHASAEISGEIVALIPGLASRPTGAGEATCVPKEHREFP